MGSVLLSPDGMKRLAICDEHGFQLIHWVDIKLELVRNICTCCQYMDARMMELLELPAIAQPPTEVNPTVLAGPPFLLVVGFLHLKFTQVFIPQRYFANPRDLKVREKCIPQFLTQHVSYIDLRLNLLLPVVEEFCNLVQCPLNQRRDWKRRTPFKTLFMHSASALIILFLNLELRLLATWRLQMTLCPSGGCQPVPGLSRAASNPVPRSEIKHTSRSFATCSQSLQKNHDHADSVSPSTSANATGTMFLFPSCPIAINNECLYLA
ncbi:hypothetical protein G2W53_003367 [Senna tora]|uniref:Uncharacterized protein n=1 Tax=Senna tora TaxID=362788 RepID=A0A834XBF4_9FABA|nr:hypothetical protein G2W53_003367 [Senna tora]